MGKFIGQQFDQYIIETVIGRSQLGTVFRARTKNTNRLVALKLIDANITESPEIEQFILQTAQLTSCLTHPNIVPLLNFGKRNGRIYLASEFIEGRSLDTIQSALKKNRRVMQMDQALHIAAQLADGLEVAHQEGLVHGNLKPSNVLVVRPNNPPPGSGPSFRALLSDFGMSLIPEQGIAAAQFTPTKLLPYLSPEQCTGAPLDGRSDIYSLGVILYQLMSGRIPFNVTSSTEAIMRHSLERPLPIVTLRPGLPPPVAQIIDTALAKNPANRYQRASEMAQALRQITQSPEVNPAFNTPVMVHTEGQIVAETSPDIKPSYHVRPDTKNVTAILKDLSEEEDDLTKISPEQNGTATGRDMASGADGSAQRHHAPIVLDPEPVSVSPAEKVTAEYGAVVVPESPTQIFQATLAETYIVISHQGRPPRYINMDRPRFRIGRAANNDIVLQAPDVSRHHAFLEMTKKGWQLTDLGSSGGTYWNRKKLKPQEPELWPADQTVQIGPYYLHWQHEKPLEEADPQVVNEQMTQLFQVPAGASQRQSVHGRFNAVLYPSLMTLGPGQETTLQIELFNQGSVIDTFKLVVSGLHRSIFSLSQNMLSLAPGARASIPLVIHLPQPGTLLARRIPAGPRPFKLTIQSITFPDEMSALAGQLTVSPYESFSIGLWPGEIDNGGTCRVLTRNEGNTTTTLSLTSHDKDGRIQFVSKQQQVKLEPGDTATQDVTLYYREKPLFGRTRRIPFELEIATDNGTRKTKSGTLNIKPRIPLWVVVFLEMALIFMLVLAILFDRFAG